MPLGVVVVVLLLVEVMVVIPVVVIPVVVAVEVCVQRQYHEIHCVQLRMLCRRILCCSE